MSKQSSDDKFDNLGREGMLNPDPDAVLDELFVSSDFFDPNDLVQVKYEMLRRVAIGGSPVRETTAAFGFSRQTFYHAKADFEQSGVFGLLPFKRGPKKSHKLTKEVLDFIRDAREEEPSLRIPELTGRVKERFKIEIHQQSIQRAIGRIQRAANTSDPKRAPLNVPDDLEIHFESRRVRAGGKIVRLTRTEFEILRHLISHAGTPLPHRKLLQLVWGPDYTGKMDRLRVCVNQLRKKIEPDPPRPRYILTEPSVGYYFTPGISSLTEAKENA